MSLSSRMEAIQVIIFKSIHLLLAAVEIVSKEVLSKAHSISVKTDSKIPLLKTFFWDWSQGCGLRTRFLYLDGKRVEICSAGT